MNKYQCTGGDGSEIEVVAETPREAAHAYVDGGDWGRQHKTWWCDVRVTPMTIATR